MPVEIATYHSREHISNLKLGRPRPRNRSLDESSNYFVKSGDGITLAAMLSLLPLPQSHCRVARAHSTGGLATYPVRTR